MASTFAAAVGDWTRKVDGAVEAVFKASAQRLVEEMDALLADMVYNQPATPNYTRTGFLRASLVASTTAMPLLNRVNPGAPVAQDMSEVMLVIEGAEPEDVVFLGYTAEYGAHVAFGANGAGSRPWVSLAAQRWSAIVAEVSAETRQRLGL